MDLKVVIANSIFRKRGINSIPMTLFNLKPITLVGNYFIVIQLDELSFPSKETKTIKFRTEVIPLSSTPKY